MPPPTTQTPLPPNPFSPSPAAAAAILNDLVSPDLTLRDIARDHNTTLDALTAWLAQDDTRARLHNIEEAYAHKARLVATAHLPALAHLLTRIVDEHTDEAAHIPVNPKSLPALEQRRRSRETARRAASLLLRLARFTTTHSPSSSPSPPRGTGVPPVRSSRRQTSPPQSPTALPSARPTDEYPPRRHAEDEAPSSLLSSSTTPNPRVSPSPAHLPTASSPLSLWERSGEGSCFCLPVFLHGFPNSFSPLSGSPQLQASHLTSPPAYLPTSSSPTSSSTSRAPPHP